MNFDLLQKLIPEDVVIEKFQNIIKMKSTRQELHEINIKCNPEKIIFPLREGELIEQPGSIPIGTSYSLSYPGTASTKCVVIFQDEVNFFIGGIPSYEYTKIFLQKINLNQFNLKFLSKDHEYYLIPFKKDWREALQPYKKLLKVKENLTRTRMPRFMLQLGVKDSNGKVYIKNFLELYPVIELFHRHFGDGHLIHFFGTNKDGYDRMFPDYTLDPDLGGEKAFTQLLNRVKSLNLLTSHHYNPRIADTNWIAQNPEYREAIVLHEGVEVKEPYKGHLHYVMNLNHDLWFNRCLETVNYLANLGFDYLEIDQFTYQRNFYHPGKPLALGYQKLVDKFIELGINFWLEGVSDIFRIPPGNFYQILIRDNSQLWEDGENRRGYPYGRSFAEFFMSLYPDSEVSYQIFTENKLFDKIEERLHIARKINAAVYDIELGFYDSNYVPNLKNIIQILKEHAWI